MIKYGKELPRSNLVLILGTPEVGVQFERMAIWLIPGCSQWHSGKVILLDLIKSLGHTPVQQTKLLFWLAHPINMCASKKMETKGRKIPQKRTHRNEESTMTPHEGQSRTWHCAGDENTLSCLICQGHWTAALEIPTVYKINVHSFWRQYHFIKKEQK